MRIKITVTQKDIRNGKHGSARSCPIALAVRRKVNKDVTVCGILEIDGFEWTMPKKCDRFIDRFDMFESVKPFTFTMPEFWEL